VSPDKVRRILREANISVEQAEDIYRLTALATLEERYVMPPIQREETFADHIDAEFCKGSCGLGPTLSPKRGD
jgi:nitrate reductase beta subunit